MFCASCGKKMKNGAKFCGECGAKVEKKKIEFKFDKKMIAIISAIVVVIGLFIYGKITTSPKYVANKYIKAVVNKDSNTLYNYLDLDGDKTFTSKSIFKKLVDNNTNNSNIENYKITKVSYETGDISAKVYFTYTIKGSEKEYNRYVALNKSKDKKFIFFDKWNITEFTKSSVTESDYKIVVPKDSKVLYEGIKVTEKYLDKNASSDRTDVYVLPLVFTTKTEIEVTLKNGLKTKDTFTPNSWIKKYQYKVTASSLSKDDTKKIEEISKENIELIYNSAMDNKSFDDIKSNFKVKDLKDLETSYNNFSKSLNGMSNKLKKISISDVELSSVSLNSDGYLSVSVKVKSNYTVEYKLGDETKESTNDTSSYYNLIFSIENKKYDLVRFVGFKTYFFR